MSETAAKLLAAFDSLEPQEQDELLAENQSLHANCLCVSSGTIGTGRIGSNRRLEAAKIYCRCSWG
ncbi:MAG: hypothetical protein R3E01_15980 [Pirellulaceae bacterium]|nr:hypothetical protein [Planctomycetales bacterium]